MEFLRALEAIRTPAASAFMAAVTYLGDEIMLMVFAVTVFWCVSKRQGYYIFAVGLGGTAINQWLKLLCRIPRPWVLDPSFTIVESARAAATGYSFPSGHTQNIVGSLGCIAMANRQKWLRALCAAFILLVPFSRMYLGVHTPLDVGVAFALSAVLIAVLWPAFRLEAHFRIWGAPVLLLLSGAAAVYLAFVLRLDPANLDPENLSSGVKNAWTILGCAAALIVTYCVDRKWLHFDEKATFAGQLCKLVPGLALLIALRAGLKAIFAAVAPGALWTDAPRYFVMVVFAGCVWPMTFPFFARLGAGKKTSDAVDQAVDQAESAPADQA